MLFLGCAVMVVLYMFVLNVSVVVFFFQAEDGIRDLVRSRGLGDVYKRQDYHLVLLSTRFQFHHYLIALKYAHYQHLYMPDLACLLYTSDAADERSSVDLGGRRIIKKKTNDNR
mgnify:CR=1 FL=1